MPRSSLTMGIRNAGVPHFSFDNLAAIAEVTSTPDMRELDDKRMYEIAAIARSGGGDLPNYHSASIDALWLSPTLPTFRARFRLPDSCRVFSFGTSRSMAA